jgi:hypothetical protein
MQIGRVIEETVVVPDSVVEAVDEVPEPVRADVPAEQETHAEEHALG